MKSYGKVQQLGDRQLEKLFHGHVTVEEKVDGSLFRARINSDGSVECGSRSVEFNQRGIDKNFKIGIDAIESGVKKMMDVINTQICPIDIFCEYLRSPKHNTLRYDKVPTNNLVVFDVFADGRWFSRIQKELVATTLGLDIIPELANGDGAGFNTERINELLKTPSYLGGTVVEGVVIKNYSQFYQEDHPYNGGIFLRGKIVRAEFKEQNNAEWGVRKGHMEMMIESLRTEARFAKVYQHLRDRGELEFNMKDMKKLITEMHEDILTENGEEIKEVIWNKAWSQIRAGVVKGLPEWYKQKLLELQMEKTT